MRFQQVAFAGTAAKFAKHVLYCDSAAIRVSTTLRVASTLETRSRRQFGLRPWRKRPSCSGRFGSAMLLDILGIYSDRWNGNSNGMRKGHAQLERLSR